MNKTQTKNGLKRPRESDSNPILNDIELLSEFSKIVKPKEESVELVIPLISKNLYQSADQTIKSTSATAVKYIETAIPIRPGQPITPDGFGLIIKKGIQKQKQIKEQTPIVVDVPTSILSLEDEALNQLKSGNYTRHTLLSQNIIPGMDKIVSEKGKYLHDVDARPEEMSLEDYNRVPIEKFGAALLRGMGWKEGQAVGKNSNGLLAPVELTRRPALLGLGATPIIVEEKKRRVLPGDKIKVERVLQKEIIAPPPRKVVKKDEIERGALVSILEGSSKGLKGSIIEVSVRSNGTVVKVELSGRKEIVRVWSDQILIISKQPSLFWLRPHIRVRIISKDLKEGKYYNEKAFVQDVISRGSCTLMTDKGILLDGIEQRDLETIVPNVGGKVMVVQHSSLVGQIGRVMDYNKMNETCMVQMESSFDMETISFDDMAEYIATD